MAENLERALAAIFGQRQTETKVDSPPSDRQAETLIESAYKTY